MSAAATQASPSTVPELLEVARFALEELSAEGLIAVDSRDHEDRIVAYEGPCAELLTAGPLELPSLDEGTGCAIVGHGDFHVLSATMDIVGAEPIGAMQALIRGPAPTRNERVMRLARIFARHAALNLVYRSLRHEQEERAVKPAQLPIPDSLMDSAYTLETITEVVTQMMRPLTGAVAVAISVWDQERDILLGLPGAFGACSERLRASMTGPSSNPQSLACRVFVTGRPYMTNHAAQDPGLHQAYVRVFDIKRVLAVPLTKGAHRVGVLMLINKPSDFTLRDIAVTEAAAQRVAMAVELASTVSQLRVRQRLEGILAEAAIAVATGKPVSESLLPAFNELCAAMEANVVALIPRDDGPPLAWQAAPAPQALERRFIADARALVDGSVGAYPQSVGDPGWAALHVPVEFHGDRSAALSVLRRNGHPFSAVEAKVVNRLANIAALAWATERYQHQLAEIARLRERERIADALHDRVAQILFAGQLGLDSILERNPDAAAGRERILEVRSLLASGGAAIRDVFAQLAVPAGPTLARRLRLEVENVEKTFGVTVHLELPENDATNGIRRPVEDCIVRVAREATINAAKHAGPCRISVIVSGHASTGVILTVADDGLGSTATAAAGSGCGLRSIRQAVDDIGGTLEITPAAGMFGTRLTATFPPADCF